MCKNANTLRSHIHGRCPVRKQNKHMGKTLDNVTVTEKLDVSSSSMSKDTNNASSAKPNANGKKKIVKGNNMKKWPCNKCEKVYGSKEGLRNHKKAHNVLDQEEKGVTVSVSKSVPDSQIENHSEVVQLPNNSADDIVYVVI